MTRAEGFTRLALLSLGFAALACQRDVTTGEHGSSIAANAPAPKRPDADPAATRKPRTVKGECGVAVDGGMHALAKMRLTSDGRAHDEIWDVACFRGDCEIARLDASALSSDGDFTGSQMSAWRGVVTAPRDQVCEIKISGMADQILTVDLESKALRYRQTFKTGDVTTGVGTCASSTIGGPP